ncbi:bifunctional DNA-formamidopyrimidine glycosylase/DNA-(apurinic or apyrimidinic site) lyase [Humitalea sp. 24SJ18S-53]|uniref:bifunctional DNA-formamidopyrimidine glycosylase/DNA-(apurinic or apyrimidinic site) lyase n=1 Tax=Humitalea sp. 24SJ18S-53 TaxID=3422307 RepID=UPI003D66E40E
MPELPEVETVMRGLAAVMQGHRIVAAEFLRAGLRWPFPPGIAARLTGAKVLGFRRRAKFMLMRIEGGDSVMIHLGMSGRMVARGPAFSAPSLGPQGAISDARGHNNPPEAHEHVVLVLDDGTRIGFVDPRRFGSVDLVPTAAEDEHRLLRGMGPEPLDDAFTPAILGAALAGKHTPIKAALLDQKVVAGLGNIYVAEALYRAGISPRRLAYTVAGSRATKLVPAIKAVLTESIGAGGSSLRDYVRADGEIGIFQERFAVYGRKGEPCPDCPGLPGCAGVEQITQSGRSSFFCPKRQR